MKKLIILIFTAIIAVSCSDNLDKSPLNRISENDVWQNEELIQAYISASYNNIGHGFQPDFLSSATDETHSHNNSGEYISIIRGQLTADNVTKLDNQMNYWSFGYSTIRSINIFFEEIDSSPLSVNDKAVMIGEMKFIRAFIYAKLIWRYGGVPIIDKVYKLNDDYTVTRDSYDDCVSFIVKELNDAIAVLPARQTGADLGRASGDASKALKARVLLYAASPLNNPTNDKAKWQKAADAAELLVNSSYSLNDDYQSTFLGDNNEIIFARYFTQANSHDVNKWLGRNADSGFGSNAPTQNMVDDYEMTNGQSPFTDATHTIVNTNSGYDPTNPFINRDPRFYASILYDGSIWMGRETETFVGGLDSRGSTILPFNATMTGYYMKKFLLESLPPVGSTDKATNPWIYFRYAEILLNYAEAKFELGDEAIARQYLNMVRSRASVNMPAVTETGDALRVKIQNERRIELAFENHRYFDVRRWKIANVTESLPMNKITITKNAVGIKTYKVGQLLARSFSDSFYLLPIPRTEIEKSLNSLVQNTGY